jgi:hypothetical protein
MKPQIIETYFLEPSTDHETIRDGGLAYSTCRYVKINYDELLGKPRQQALGNGGISERKEGEYAIKSLLAESRR